jgi:photosystem II stability/assembly factor-like uncharacterized protein
VREIDSKIVREVSTARRSLSTINPMKLPLARVSLHSFVFSLLSLALAVPIAAGGVNVWTTSGPLPKLVTALAAESGDASLIYAAVYEAAGNVGSVFRSANDGATWTRTTLSEIISALATGPAGTVYAGGGSAFKSTDGGATWQPIRPAEPNTTARLIRVNPQNPSTVYLANAFTIAPLGDPGGYLVRSTDGGFRWKSIEQGLLFGSVLDLEIDPANPATLHLVKQLGYWRSDDSGDHWTKLGNGLPTSRITALALDPTRPQTIYAAGRNGLFRSLDSGVSFSVRGSGFPSAISVTGLAIDPANPSRLFVGAYGHGVFSSQDAGLTWEPLNAGLSSLDLTSLVMSSNGTLHAATRAGVFEYRVGIDTATLLLNASHVFRFVLNARDPRTGSADPGVAVPLNDQAGYFTIPALTQSPETPEVFVKIVDGRAINGAWWVFHGALTDLEYTLTVTEEATGRVKTYFKEAGSACGGFDTSAFPSSP